MYTHYIGKHNPIEISKKKAALLVICIEQIMKLSNHAAPTVIHVKLIPVQRNKRHTWRLAVNRKV